LRLTKKSSTSPFLDCDNASYDGIAKRFLAHKILLAQILKELVEELKDCPFHHYKGWAVECYDEG